MLAIDTATFSRPNKLRIEENRSVISGYVNRTFNRNAKKEDNKCFPNASWITTATKMYNAIFISTSRNNREIIFCSLNYLSYNFREVASTFEMIKKRFDNNVVTHSKEPVPPIQQDSFLFTRNNNSTFCTRLALIREFGKLFHLVFSWSLSLHYLVNLLIKRLEIMRVIN